MTAAALAAPIAAPVAALAVRGTLFALVSDPAMVVAAQVFDGISAVALGVMVPLIVADITRGSGRFNSALGVVGMIAGVGGALSTTLAGAVTDHIGAHFAFVGLASAATLAFVAALLFLPETRPREMQ